MTFQELENAKKRGQVKTEERPQMPESAPEKPFSPGDMTLEEFLPLLMTARLPIRHVTTAPTYVPVTFFDHFCFYDDGAARRAYFYINNTWRYVALT